MTYIEQARKLRPLVVKAAQSLDDKDASEAVALFARYGIDTVDVVKSESNQ